MDGSIQVTSGIFMGSIPVIYIDEKILDLSRILMGIYQFYQEY